MKRILPVLFLLLAAALYLGSRTAPDSSASDAVAKAAKPAADQPQVRGNTAPRPSTRASAAPQGQVAKPVAGGKPAVAPEPEATDGFVKKVIVESWTDAAEDKAGRRRVRIVQADFKYPHVRLEEEVWTDPDTGKQTVKRIRASVADHLMVGLKPGADAKAAQAVLENNGYRIRAVEPGSYILAELPDFKHADAQEKSIAEIEGLGEFIDYAEPDWLVYPCLQPNDPAYTNRKMWGLDNPGTVAGTVADADIDAPEAWDLRTDASNVIVAVTDTGIQYNHEDLAPNMWSDGSGQHGYDAYDNDNDPMDTGGHGTHCAGTIGAKGNNGTGLAGVAWDVQLMALRFLGPYGGSTSDGIKVINYARQNGAHIISASWGGGGYSQGLYDAIKAAGDAGIPFVAAAGNDGVNNDSSPHYPSSYDLPTLVAVASTTSQDQLSYFSCYGRYSVDIAAPGSDIWSCYIGSNSSYKHLNGTSMATPHVSGALALAKAQFPSEDAEDLIARLYSSVDPIPALAGKVATGGRLNLQKLLGASAAAIGHDDFDNALRFEGNYGHWSGSNQKATREADEDTFSIPGTGDKSVWFAWKAPYKGLVEFSVEASDHQFRVLAFHGDEKGGLTIAADDESQSLRKDKTLHFYCEQDQEYRFLIDTDKADGVNLLATLSLKPVNDAIGSALELSGDRFSTQGNNRNATAESFEIASPHAGVGKGKTVWWKWTPDFDGEFVITTQGSEFDTVLAVYSGSPGALAEVGTNDDRNALDWTSQVTFNAVSGTTYYIAVDGYRGDAAGGILLNGFKGGQLAILKQPQGVTASVSDRVVFDVSVASSIDLDYQWFQNGEPLPGQTSNTYVIDAVESRHFGNYTVLVTNADSQLMSNVVELKEKLIAPHITWYTGDQAVPEGVTVSLAVTVAGSGPLSYQWYKDGSILAGENKAAITFENVTIADKGNYLVEVSNSQGKIEQGMKLVVAENLWERLEQRNPAIGGDPVTDMKAYAGEVYAVAGDTLHYSTDGETWSKSKFPYGFTGRTFAQAGDRRICLGFSLQDEPKVAVSVAGAAWNVYDYAGLSPVSGTASQYVLYTINNTFIAQYNNLDTASETAVYYSADGVTWHRCKVSFDGTTSSDFSCRGRISSDGQTMIAVANDRLADDKITYYSSADGKNWVGSATHAVPDLSWQEKDNEARTSAHFNNEFHLIGDDFVFSSPDGQNWVFHRAKGSVRSDDLLIEHDQALIAFSPSVVKWYSGSYQLDTKICGDYYDEHFQSAVSFNGKIITGTDYGNVASSGSVDEIRLHTTEKGYSHYRSLDFVDGRFHILSDSSVSTVMSHQMVSGDAKTWKKIPKDAGVGSNYAGFAMGVHWGSLNSTDIVAGTTPYGLNTLTKLNGMTGPLDSIAEDSEGNIIAKARDSSSTRQVFYKQAGASEFVQISIPSGMPQGFVNYGGCWYPKGQLRYNDTEIYTSLNGVNWTASGISGYFVQVVEKDGHVFLFCTVNEGAPVVAKTADGVNWSVLSTTGLPAAHLGSPHIWRMAEYQGNLVALLSGKIYYSTDGEVWVQANIRDVRDMAYGNGELVFLTGKNGLVRVGGDSLGESAPHVSISAPRHRGVQMMGTEVLVTGSVMDPEDGAVSYTCYVDNEVVDSGVGTDFSFRYRVNNMMGHVVIVEAVDSDGYKQHDAIRLDVSSNRNNILDPDVTGPGSLPIDFSAELGGVTYVASLTRLYRSHDLIKWERVHLPALHNKIIDVVAGNGALVVRLEDGEILTTRDGINWVGTTTADTKVWGGPSLRFEQGRFIVSGIIGTPGNSSLGMITSSDGLVWERTNTYGTAHAVKYCTNGSGTFVSSAGYVSHDGGTSWDYIDVFGVAGEPNQSICEAIFSNGQFVLIHFGTKKSAVSDDGIEWTVSESPEIVGSVSSASLKYCGDRYFLCSPSVTRTSLTGADWQKVSGGAALRDVVYARGVYLGLHVTVDNFNKSHKTVMGSLDGIDWKDPEGDVIPAKVESITTGASGFLAIDEYGEAWTSGDGRLWSKAFTKSDTEGLDMGLPKEIEKIGNRLVVAGSEGLFYSDDDGGSWNRCNASNVSGAPVTNVVRLKSSDTKMFALTSGKGLFSTSDGIDWTVVNNPLAVTVCDFDYNGSEWRMIGESGLVIRSVDGGETWEEVQHESLDHGRFIAWFDNQWVVVGAAGPNPSSPFKSYYAYSLYEDNTKSANALLGYILDQGFLSYYQKLVAHGRMFVWSGSSKLFYTEDGISWQKSSFPGNSGQIDIVSTPEGYTCLMKASNNKRYMYQSPADQLSWSEVNSHYANVEQADNLGTRAFVFGTNAIYEDAYKDVAIQIDSTSPVSVGVGDSLPCDVSILNLGSVDVRQGGWLVEAWLSKDRMYGHGNDVFLGYVSLSEAMPAPSNGINKTLHFELPSDVNTGDNFLVLKLKNADPQFDANMSNNVAISEVPFVTIPEWELNLNSNGNGQINQNFAAVRYPHGSRVSLTANAGKGAAFAGWGGDAVGAQNQITILMDGDKSVLANFASRASLQVHVRGAGEVTGLADLASYPVGDTASLTAVPAVGWMFSGWSGAATGGSASANITMDSNKVVTATFVKLKDTWKSDHFSAAELGDPAISGDDADPDGDGLNNWQEYLHLSNPKEAASRGIVSTRVEGGYLFTIFTRNAGIEGGLSLLSQGSRDLNDWNAPDLQERVLSTVNGVETVEARIPATEGKGFIRLKYTR